MGNHANTSRPAKLSWASHTGTSLVEALVSIFLLGLILLSLAQLIVTTVGVHAAAADITGATSLAEHKLEELRNTEYDNLTPGGDLAADVAGFFDQRDVDGDGTVEFQRRWQVTDNGDDTKTIQVFVEALVDVAGPEKSSTVIALVAQLRQ